MRVTELARAGGVTAETVRHYTREGLLRPQRDPRNGYQLYDEEALGRLRLIDCLRSLGVGLPDIKKILTWADQGSPPLSDTYAPLVEQRPYIRSRIHELQAIARWLESIDHDNASEAPSLKQLIESLGSAQPAIVTDGPCGCHQ
ncbi:MerR family transcriptional regulator [Halomonas sp. 5021]|jgi:DNA-binding transcriptional MerR regulator|uniref:DNA-binding protein n=1 Tax=Halomonas salipaludis TaxID=2032625 RepID=A0A2A2ERH0_9GAMM|nr:MULTISPECIES: MerR family transcriptional regulator [Halomonas]PAU74989.1 DNA-binding protein [Halomonas salipaludis]QPL46158.1 MerR family transcriptional regulator [Halomonas sp. A40-4]